MIEKMKIEVAMVGINLNRLAEKITIKIAWMLPKKLVEWCALRLMAHATQGKCGNESPSDVNIMTALKRWNDDTRG